MTLRFTPRARDDLRQIMDYIAKENPVGADRVGRAVFDTCALIAARPYLGIRNARAPELRSRLVTRGGRWMNRLDSNAHRPLPA
jgi:toxin ParE1/3/4